MAKKFKNSIILGGVEVVNLTPHSVVLYLPSNRKVEIKPEGIVPRVATKERQTNQLEGLPVIEQSYSQPENLPEPQAGVIFIVSSIVSLSIEVRKRNEIYRDIFIPAHFVRDEQGRIIGCRALALVK